MNKPRKILGQADTLIEALETFPDSENTIIALARLYEAKLGAIREIHQYWKWVFGLAISAISIMYLCFFSLLAATILYPEYREILELNPHLVVCFIALFIVPSVLSALAFGLLRKSFKRGRAAGLLKATSTFLK